MKKIFCNVFFMFAVLVLSTHIIAAEKPSQSKFTIRTDKKSIEAGKNLFNEKCFFCHDAYSTKTTVGPGLKGVLKNPTLPVSKRPATPDNIADQIRNPFKDMTPFTYFTDEDILNIIAFLNTL